jgi:cytochrome bd-type quinol oxidase subunit 2
MVSKIKKYTAILLASIAMAVPVAVLAPVAVYAQDDSPEITGPLCSGVEFEFNTDGGDCGSVDGSGDKLTTIIKTVINILSVIVGVVAVVMIIFGGLKYITSGGDSSNVSSAKNTIIYAIVGLVIVALAQFIVRFVLDKSINASGS